MQKVAHYWPDFISLCLPWDFQQATDRQFGSREFGTFAMNGALSTTLRAAVISLRLMAW